MHQNVLDDLDIRQFKLVNGEEVVAFVQAVVDEGYILENPLQICYNLDSDDAKQEFYFVRWMSFVEKTESIFVNEDKVLASAQCMDELKIRYVSISTGPKEDEEEPYDEVESDNTYYDELDEGTTTIH